MCLPVCEHVGFISVWVKKTKSEKERETGMEKKRGIDIPLTSSPGTMRLSADEIQIIWKAVQ